MKTLVRPEQVVQAQTRKSWVEPVLQLLINITAVYAANQISIEVWRSMTGH